MADLILNVVESDGMREELWSNAYWEYEKLSWQGSAEKMHGHYHSLAGANNG